MTATMGRVTDEDLRTAAREAAATLLALTERAPRSADACPMCGSTTPRHATVVKRRGSTGSSSS